MEKYEWKENVELICFQAKKFPDDIQEAFDTLQRNISDCENRTWYGISYQGSDGEIIYKAAITRISPDEEHPFENFTVTTGTYLSEEIYDWMKHPAQIGESFMRMLTDPRLDTTFPCVEWYHDDDVTCLVRLKEN
ncbi:MAG TPA: hypothetical protein VGN64_15850 [Dyadobacter sp.]|jgi:hypothetical protein|nr:hypothetical protein [Dyadobacter sp.]